MPSQELKQINNSDSYDKIYLYIDFFLMLPIYVAHFVYQNASIKMNG